MSYDNAISVRGQMNLAYQKMLEEETNPNRIEDIKKQIKINEEEINQLRQGKPLFGNPTVLKQETKIIEPDPETKGQKVTILDKDGNIAPSEPNDSSSEPEEAIDPEISSVPSKKVGNKLRDILQGKANSSTEESLKAKVLAAKAAKAKSV